MTLITVCIIFSNVWECNRILHSRCINADTLYPISAQRMNYSDFHKNRVRYNINTTN